jgi:hypothetical protein
LATTYGERKLEDYIIRLNLFFNCARYSDNCEEPSLEQQFNPAFVMIFYVLSAYLPVFLLVYVVDCEKLKKYVTGKKEVTYKNSAQWTSKASRTSKASAL